MKRLWIVGMFVGISWSGRPERAPQSLAAGCYPKLTIRYYNLANIPAKTLDRGLAIAGQILANAGVSVVWTEGSPDSDEGKTTDVTGSTPGTRPIPDTRDYLAVRFVAGMPVPAGATGYALPLARQGVHATIFYEVVEKLFFSLKPGPGIAGILGAALAHEVGHVLLGSTEHSPAGIMKAKWSQTEFRLLICQRLLFAPENGESMRAGALAVIQRSSRQTAID